MPTDVKLDQIDGTFVQVEGRVLKVVGSDFILDSPDRRTNNTPNRRALVHDGGDGLTVNFGNDYPGGITLNGVAAITPLATHTILPALNAEPKLVVHGDITYETRSPQLVGGGFNTSTNSVAEQIGTLHSLIDQLTSRIAALEARVG